MPQLFSFLSRGLREPRSSRRLPSFRGKPVHEDYMEGCSKSSMHVSLRDISMLNNSPRHLQDKRWVPCYTHLSRINSSRGIMTGSSVRVYVCVCVRDGVEQKRGTFCWQVHLAVKAPLFNSQTTPSRTQSTTPPLLLVHLRAQTLKVCPWQFAEVLSLQSGPECCFNARRSLTSSRSAPVFYSLYLIPAPPLSSSILSLVPLSACMCVLFI